MGRTTDVAGQSEAARHVRHDSSRANFSSQPSQHISMGFPKDVEFVPESTLVTQTPMRSLSGFELEGIPVAIAARGAITNHPGRKRSTLSAAGPRRIAGKPGLRVLRVRRFNGLGGYIPGFELRLRIWTCRSKTGFRWGIEDGVRRPC